jgi:hypothetical protein
MHQLFRLLVRPGALPSAIRHLHVSRRSQGLSDPFKPSPGKSAQEPFKLKKTDVATAKDNFFTRFIQKSLNPAPINNSLRQKFGLSADFKLIYFIERERMHMIVFGLMNSVFPAFFVLIGLFAYAEYTGQSQLSKSFDSPYLFAACVTGYFAFAFVMSRMAQARQVPRDLEREEAFN